VVVNQSLGVDLNSYKFSILPNAAGRFFVAKKMREALPNKDRLAA